MDFDLPSLTNNRQKQPKLHLKKYINFILAKKYWILISAIIFTILWYYSYLYYQAKIKEYTATAIIRFDDPSSRRDIAALTDFSAGIATRDKARMLNTNNFLKKVVDSLKLNILLSDTDLPRASFIKSIEFSEPLYYGSYYFKIEDDIKLFRSDADDGEKYILVKKYPLSERDSLVVEKGGMKAVFAIPEWFEEDEIYFNIVQDLYSYKILKERLSYVLEPRSNLMTLSFIHKNPQFAKYACNKIASIYIDHLLDFKKQKTISILKSLKEQLQISQAQLKTAERELKNFQEKNPRVYLTSDRGEFIRELAGKEVEGKRIRDLKRQIADFESKLSLSKGLHEKNYVYQEILSFLEQQGIPGVNLFITNLSQNILELERLYSLHYSESSSDVVRVKEKIIRIHKEADERLADFKANLIQQEQHTFDQIYQARSVLRQIPKKQLQLAELERERQINADIVSSIMAKLTEAKVSDAAVIPDAQIIDYAEVPLVIPITTIQKIVILFVGLLLGTIFSTAVLIVIVTVNGKFWTSEELEEKTGLPILAELPALSNHFENGQSMGQKIDPMLVTYSYEPTYSAEAFRKMRTLMEMEEKENKQIILVGSLKPSEGKSYISVNLATVYAQQRQKVLLIDGDIRRGVLHSFFTKKKKPGLTDLLISKSNINYETIEKYLQKTEVPNLYLFPSGQLVPNPAEILGGKRFGEFLEHVSDFFNKIVVDSAPFSLCTDIFIMNKWIHNILLVTRYQSTNLTELIKFLDEYQGAKEDFRGIAVNFINEKYSKHGYSGYNYYKY